MSARMARLRCWQPARRTRPRAKARHSPSPTANIVRTFRWAPAGGDAAFTMGYYIDPAAAAMLVMVTIASTCIHLFSLGYMAHDERQSRFFSFISLFTAAMLLMVMASNLLLFFMAWELMGLCSYLLIGFWYDKVYADPRQITPRQAAIKAFITTRVGDVLFMVGLAYLWTQAGSLDFGAGEGQIFNPEFLAHIGGDDQCAGHQRGDRHRAAAVLPARSASRRSSRCMSGCRTRWRGRRRSRR